MSDSAQELLDEIAREDAVRGAGQRVSVDLEAGAPLTDRLAAAFKFDPQGVENYLKEEYGSPNVFRDDKGELFFLPPDQLALPQRYRTFVKFNPKGVDVGDVLEFVPAAIGAAGGALAAFMSGGASVPITLAALGAGGAAGEAAVQGVGAMLPGEEPTGTAGERLGRIATSAALEAGGGIVGDLATAAAKPVGRAIREESRRAVQRMVRTGTRPQDVADVQALGRRTGIEFSEGQISGSRAALLLERFMRQNWFSAGIVKEADAAAVDRLGAFAERQIGQLTQQPFETGVRNAVQAHEAHVQALADKRAELVRPLFAKARAAFGNERVVPLDNAIARMQRLADDWEADAGSESARESVKFIAETIEGIPGGRTSIKSLQNMLQDWGRSAADPRRLTEKVLDHSMKKRMATEFFRGLQEDLAASIDSLGTVAREGVTGQFRSQAKVADALTSLRDARAIYREMSQAIADVVDNPIAEFAENPERLANMFLGSASDATNARKVMGFLDETAPDQANELRGTVLQQIIRRASRGNVDEPLSPALLRSIADKAKPQLDALFAGNTEARSAFNDMITASRKLADQGSLQGAQTEFMKIIENSLRAVGLTAVVSPAIGGGGISESGEELAGLGALALSTRWLARSMMHPPAARAYARVFTAAARPRLSKGARRAVQQAVVDLVGFNQRMDATERRPSDGRPLAERAVNLNDEGTK